jgi:DNA-binding transcriptional LysR family regulator
MLDPVTLDQLRVLATVASEGSFSAAARRLRRVQSAISTQMANLESQLDVVIWDRSTKIPSLTPAGQALLASAQRVLAEVDDLRTLASSVGAGLEPQVSLCVDALFPLDALLAICTDFAAAFPQVDLRIDTQVMSAVAERVLRGAATLGVAGPMGALPGLERRALAVVRMVPVVAPGHPLAAVRGIVSNKHLRSAVQIVLSERLDEGAPDQGVLSPRTWRVGELHPKHEMRRAGRGWGNLPAHLVAADLASGRLVAIKPESYGRLALDLHLFLVYRADTTLGPAHRWIIERLEGGCAKTTPGVRKPSRK